MRLALRHRLVVLVVAAMVPLFGLSLANALLSERAAVRRATGELKLAASLVATHQSRTVDSAHQLLEAVMNAPGLANGSSADCPHYLATLKNRLPMYSNLGFIGLDGYISCHSMLNRPLAFVGDRDYFQDTLRRRKFTVGGYKVSRMDGRSLITYTMPVMNAEAKITALVFVAVDLDQITREVAALPLPEGSRLAIMDSAGIVLAASPPNRAFIGKKAPTLLLQDALKRQGGGMQAGGGEGLDAQGRQRLFAFEPARHAGEATFLVAVSATRDDVLAPARKQLQSELAALVLVALFGGTLAWRMGGRVIVAPTMGLLEAARQVQAGCFDARVATGALDDGSEFSSIAAGFNLMAESLQQQRQALQAELANSEAVQEKLRDAQRVACIGYWQMDLATRQLWCSDEVYALLGVERASFEASAASFAGLIHPGDRDHFQARSEAAIQTAEPLDIEFRILTPAGELRWMRQTGRSHASSPEQGAARRSGVLQDITGQHEAQEQLRLLETCIARLNDMVVITGPMTASGPKIVFVNDAFERLSGYSREEVMGKTPGFMRGPATQPSVVKQLSVALRAGQPVRAELINYTKSGQAFWLEIDIVPVLDAKETITHFVAVERDITQRKRAEQALVDSEQRYAALFASAPVPMWVYDLVSTRFLTVNQAAQDSYGYDAQEFLAMTLFDIRPRAEHARLRQQLGQGMPGRRTAWQHQRKDGSVFPVDVVSQPIAYAGRAARFVVALDMSAQLKAEEEVRQHLFMLQRAADAAQAITWHQTLEGTMQEIADQARGVIGAHQAMVSLSRGQGQNQEAVHALSPCGAHAASLRATTPSTGAGLDTLVFETGRALRLTQAELQAHPRWQGSNAVAAGPCLRGWLAVPLTGRQGQNIGLLQLSDKYEGEFTRQDEYVAIELAHLASAAIENTRLLEEVSQLNAGLEQKVAERTAELARQEALFRALAEQAPQAVWTASPEGAATYYNRAWFELMGGQFKDWDGYQWLSAVHPEDVADIKARWAGARASLLPYSGTRRFLAKDDCFHTMSYRASPVLDDQGGVAFWVGIDADITELKATEAALRLSNQELEAFSYSVSHDLRAPLNTVDGFSRLLAKQLAGAADEKVVHYLSRIQAGVAQMGRLIEDLLSLSQLTRAQLRREPLDLTEKATGILAEWHARQPERQVVVSVQAGLRAEGDGRLLRVALENLLANAWKFTSQQARAEISVGQRLDAAGQPVFFVRDNGAGFDMAYADKLFTPFQRLHAAAEFPGTGIGLAIVSRVIERHGGRLWAESAPGCGATFFFTLPRLRQLA
jgi:PAS domain S-box-containing protein